MSNANDGPRWVRNVLLGFLSVTALVTLATAGVHPAAPEATSSVSGYVPPSMHEAAAGIDVGPGSDEALLVTSPMPE